MTFVCARRRPGGCGIPRAWRGRVVALRSEESSRGRRVRRVFADRRRRSPSGAPASRCGDYKSEQARGVRRDEEARRERTRRRKFEQAREAEGLRARPASPRAPGEADRTDPAPGGTRVRPQRRTTTWRRAHSRMPSAVKQLPKASKTTGTSGTWSQFGARPLIVNDPDYSRNPSACRQHGAARQLEYDVAQPALRGEGHGRHLAVGKPRRHMALDRRRPAEPDRGRGRLHAGKRRHDRRYQRRRHLRIRRLYRLRRLLQH
jgi:hypothetical protein